MNSKYGPILHSVLDTDPVQIISGVNVTPKPNGLTIIFNTRKACKPLVTIFQYVTGDPSVDMAPVYNYEVTAGLGPMGFSHALNMTGLGQGRAYWFRIDAGDDENRAFETPVVRAVWHDWACTLTRKCLLDVQNLQVLYTGDPDGGADMYFKMMVFNGADSIGEGLVTWFNFHSDSVDNGDNISHPFGTGPIVIDQAPPMIVPYVSATRDAHGGFGGLSTLGTGPDEGTPTLPDAPRKESNDYYDFVDSFTNLTLPDSIGSWSPGVLYLQTDILPVSFVVSMVIQSTVSDTDPNVCRNRWPKTPFQVGHSTMVAIRSLMPKTLQAGKRLVMFRFGSKGNVYRKLGQNLSWHDIGGRDLQTMIALAHNDGAVDLVAQDANKMLWTAHLAEVASQKVKWLELGLKVSEEPTALSGPNGLVEVLALDEKGHLQKRTLTRGSPKGAWDHLGGPFIGRAVAAIVDGQLLVAARDHQGKVCYRNAAAAGKNWRKVTAPVDLLLSMLATEKGKAMIVGMDGRRIMHTLELGEEQWKAIGTPEELLNRSMEPLDVSK